jgi:hypothetical protein
MTLEEANIVAQIAATADSGCSVCARDLLERLEKAFPEFEWKLTEEEWLDPDTTNDSYEGYKYSLKGVASVRTN